MKWDALKLLCTLCFLFILIFCQPIHAHSCPRSYDDLKNVESLTLNDKIQYQFMLNFISHHLYKNNQDSLADTLRSQTPDYLTWTFIKTSAIASALRYIISKITKNTLIDGITSAQKALADYEAPLNELKIPIIKQFVHWYIEQIYIAKIQRHPSEIIQLHSLRNTILLLVENVKQHWADPQKNNQALLLFGTLQNPQKSQVVSVITASEYDLNEALKRGGKRGTGTELGMGLSVLMPYALEGDLPFTSTVTLASRGETMDYQNPDSFGNYPITQSAPYFNGASGTFWIDTQIK